MNVPVSQSLDLIFQVLEKKYLTKEKLKKFSHDLFNKSVYLKYYSNKKNHKNPKLMFENVQILYE